MQIVHFHVLNNKISRENNFQDTRWWAFRSKVSFYEYLNITLSHSSLFSSTRLFHGADCLFNEADSRKHNSCEENIFRQWMAAGLYSTNSWSSADNWLSCKTFFIPEGLSKESLKDSWWVQLFLFFVYFLLHSERESITAVIFSFFLLSCVFLAVYEPSGYCF